MHRQTKLRLQLMLGTALLAAPVSAFAQTAPIQTAPAPVANAPVGLDDIVVTATKRETNLQDTPISISVMNSEALQNRHVQSLMDLADGAVPSLRVATFEARQSALTIGIAASCRTTPTSPPVSKASASMSTASIWPASTAWPPPSWTSSASKC